MLMEVLVIYNVDPPVHCVKCQNVQDASRCPHLIQCNGEVGKLLKHTDNSTPPPPHLSNVNQPLFSTPNKKNTIANVVGSILMQYFE